MTELLTLILAVATTAAIALATLLACRTVRRRREARDLERLYVEQHPLALTVAEADRALHAPSESDAPLARAPARPAATRPLALGGVTVVVALVAALLVVGPAFAPNPEAPAAGDSGAEESKGQISAPVLTREPVRHRSDPDPRVSRDPDVRVPTADNAPDLTERGRSGSPESTASTTTPTPTPDHEAPSSTTSTTSTTSTASTTTESPDLDPDDDRGHVGRPGGMPGRPRPGSPPAHADRHDDDHRAPGNGRGPRLGLLSTIVALVEDVDAVLTP